MLNKTLERGKKKKTRKTIRGLKNRKEGGSELARKCPKEKVKGNRENRMHPPD